jgi:hypothetical protein
VFVFVFVSMARASLKYLFYESRGWKELSSSKKSQIAKLCQTWLKDESLIFDAC